LRRRIVKDIDRVYLEGVEERSSRSRKEVEGKRKSIKDSDKFLGRILESRVCVMVLVLVN